MDVGATIDSRIQRCEERTEKSGFSSPAEDSLVYWLRYEKLLRQLPRHGIKYAAADSYDRETWFDYLEDLRPFARSCDLFLALRLHREQPRQNLNA